MSRKITFLSLIILLLFSFIYFSECKGKIISTTDVDTYTITLNGSVLNDISGLNIKVQIKDLKGNIATTATFSSNGASSVLSSVNGPDVDVYTITFALNGKVKDGKATISGKFIEGSLLAGAEFNVIKVERDGGTDITNSVTTDISFTNSKATPTPTPTPTPTSTSSPTPSPTSTPKGAKSLTEKLTDELEDAVVIEFTEILTDLNNAFIDLFISFTEGLDKFLDITNTASIEIENAPPIPDGDPALFDLPEIENIDLFEETDDLIEIPKGFSFASNVSFDEIIEPLTVSSEDLSNQNTAVLIDSKGKTFIVGFGFLTADTETPDFRKKKNHRFQTENGDPLKLTTTFTVPADASEGDTKVSILSKNSTLATIPFRVASPRNVKIGRRQVGKPQINEPIKALVRKSGTELSLQIPGKNFIKRIAIIDGKLERLIGKANFTNVTFVPQKGINVKAVKVRTNKVSVIAEVKGDIEPGIKLFNVITPKGADIGAIVIPETIVDGSIEATSVPDELILEDNP